MDNERYNEIVRTYSPMVYRFAPEFQSEEHLRRWLIQVTVRESRRLFAKPFRKREALLEELHPGADTLVSGSPADLTTEEGVLADVLLLPRKYRVVIYLYYYEEYSIREIAGMLGKKESTIQTQLARARKKLKQTWEMADGKERLRYESDRRVQRNGNL